MKASEVPEKIYLQENTTTDCYGEWWPEWFEARAKDSDIEYTRTDAFIEKALKWYCRDCECNDNCPANHKCAFRDFFEKYLRGNEKALPPKAEYALDSEGFTTKNYNYRYRHFIRRMNDTFIEKAAEWFRTHWRDYVGIDKDNVIHFGLWENDFKKYMKGE